MCCMECMALVVKVDLKLQSKVKFFWLYWCIYACEWEKITGAGADDDKNEQTKERKKEVISKTWTPFIERMSE